MSGIVGIIEPGSHRQRGAELRSMVTCLFHESSDTCGTFVNQQLGLNIAWTVGPDPVSDCLPVWNEERNICLILAGELFQDRVLVDRLGSQGHEIGAQHASHLVHLFEELGLKALEQMNGWFSGLIVDLRNEQAFLFNDRYGIGRVCYYENQGSLYFASEAKALLKVLPHLRALDSEGLGEFFSCGSVLQNRTLFSGISLLPGGSVWSFSRSGPVLKKTYFHPRLWEEQPVLSEADYYQQLKETWKQILPRYFSEDQKAGLSLTGGVDSRMILAWAPCPAGELPCYTFGGKYRECNDVKLARQLAKLARQPHKVIPINGAFLSQFPSLAEKVAHIGEGNLDVSGTIDLFVQQEARKIAPVRITGTNGGELLRRLVMFKPSGFPEELLSPETVSATNRAASTYADELRGHRLTFSAFKQTPWYMNSKFVVERSQIVIKLPFCDNDLVRLSYQAPPRLAESNEPALRLIAEGNPALARLGTDRALLGQTLPVLGRARHFIQEFTFKAEYAYDIGMPQWLSRLDHAVAPLHLETLFLGRHKFHHFRVYYRDELGRYIKEILLDPRTLGRPFLQARAVEAVVRSHTGGYRNYTQEIHKLLTIELMQRQLLD